MNSFKIFSYNCCSIRKNINIIRESLASDPDILFLQETLVPDDQLAIIDYIHENYKSINIPASYSEKSLLSFSGRPMGGLTCLYRSDVEFEFKPIYFDHSFMSINCIIDDNNILFVNCYIKSDLGTPDALHNYLQDLYSIEENIKQLNFESIFLIGDFNADPFIGRAWSSLSEFMIRNNLYCIDYNKLNQDTFTHVNYGTSLCKWLDHVVVGYCNTVSVGNIEVMYDMIGSDHFPIKFTINIEPKAYKNNNKKKHIYRHWLCRLELN